MRGDFLAVTTLAFGQAGLSGSPAPL